MLRPCMIATWLAPLLVAACSSVSSGYEVVSHTVGPQVTDPVMRSALERSGKPWKVRDRATGIEMVLVMPGAFLMGAPESEPGRGANESPPRRVEVSEPFYLGTTEITQGTWRRVLGEARGFFPGDDRPADGSWDDLVAFLGAANASLPRGASPLRAPTEAEWEYACRAGTTGPFSFDGPARHELLNFNDGDVERAVVVDGRLEVEWKRPPSEACPMATVAAGSLPPNPWGLFEMHGNLWEWTSSDYATATEREGPRLLALRGGSWYDAARFCRSAARDAGAPSVRSNRIGFRVARTLP